MGVKGSVFGAHFGRKFKPLVDTDNYYGFEEFWRAVYSQSNWTLGGKYG